LCVPYVFIDASTEGNEEEEIIYGEEEEYFDHYTNQGKLALMHLLMVQANAHESIASHPLQFILFEPCQSQVLLLQALLLFIKLTFILPRLFL
jgi:hypothetical protein